MPFILVFSAFLARPAWAAPGFDEAGYSAGLFRYVSTMLLALLVLGLLWYAAARFLPGRLGARARGHIKVLGMLNVGREMVYIVRTGPEVSAFVSGKMGSTVLGRWSLEEWDDYEAAAGDRESRPAE